MTDTLWVFGYGSLVWNPGFEVAEARRATLPGWRRSFCMWSIHHRGTPEAPGLVLALDAAEGAECRGMAFRVAPGQEDETLAALRERELVSSAYLEQRLPVRFEDGGEVAALVYVVDPSHPQYARLGLDEQARIIAGATGGRGPNTEYLYNTAEHLAALGIEDEELSWLARVVRAMG